MAFVHRKRIAIKSVNYFWADMKDAQKGAVFLHLIWSYSCLNLSSYASKIQYVVAGMCIQVAI